MSGSLAGGPWIGTFADGPWIGTSAGDRESDSSAEARESDSSAEGIVPSNVGWDDRVQVGGDTQRAPSHTAKKERPSEHPLTLRVHRGA